MSSFKPLQVRWGKCRWCGKDFQVTYATKQSCSPECKAMSKLDKTLTAKKCALCGKDFYTKSKSKNICSLRCRRNHKHSEDIRYKKNKGCAICGWKETIDIHHDSRGVYVLCPNHHALITRGISTIEELLKK